MKMMVALGVLRGSLEALDRSRIEWLSVDGGETCRSPRRETAFEMRDPFETQPARRSL